MSDKILNIPSMSIFNNDWDLLLKFMENEGNPHFHIEGDVNFFNKKVRTLGNLVSVGGNIELYGSSVKSLENLETVGGYLELRQSNIIDFNKLKYVGGNLNANGTSITTLGNLERVDGNIYLIGCYKLDMTEKQIRKQVKVMGDIYIEL